MICPSAGRNNLSATRDPGTGLSSRRERLRREDSIGHFPAQNLTAAAVPAKIRALLLRSPFPEHVNLESTFP